jgi:hypothetical protein
VIKQNDESVLAPTAEDAAAIILDDFESYYEESSLYTVRDSGWVEEPSVVLIGGEDVAMRFMGAPALPGLLGL